MTTEAPRDAMILAHLPGFMRDTVQAEGPMGALLEASEVLLAPGRAVLEQDTALFDPLTTTREMLPFLAGWLGYGGWFHAADTPGRLLSLEDGFPPGEARLRQFLSNWQRLRALRGTMPGLTLLLEIATGLAPFEIGESAREMHIHVRAPAGAARFEPWLKRVIADERPLHLTWSLSLAGAEAAP